MSDGPAATNLLATAADDLAVSVPVQQAVQPVARTVTGPTTGSVDALSSTGLAQPVSTNLLSVAQETLVPATSDRATPQAFAPQRSVNPLDLAAAQPTAQPVATGGSPVPAVSDGLQRSGTSTNLLEVAAGTPVSVPVRPAQNLLAEAAQVLTPTTSSDGSNPRSTVALPQRSVNPLDLASAPVLVPEALPVRSVAPERNLLSATQEALVASPDRPVSLPGATPLQSAAVRQAVEPRTNLLAAEMGRLSELPPMQASVTVEQPRSSPGQVVGGLPEVLPNPLTAAAAPPPVVSTRPVPNVLDLSVEKLLPAVDVSAPRVQNSAAPSLAVAPRPVPNMLDLSVEKLLPAVDVSAPRVLNNVVVNAPVNLFDLAARSVAPNRTTVNALPPVGLLPTSSGPAAANPLDLTAAKVMDGRAGVTPSAVPVPAGDLDALVAAELGRVPTYRAGDDPNGPPAPRSGMLAPLVMEAIVELRSQLAALPRDNPLDLTRNQAGTPVPGAGGEAVIEEIMAAIRAVALKVTQILGSLDDPEFLSSLLGSLAEPTAPVPSSPDPSSTDQRALGRDQ